MIRRPPRSTRTDTLFPYTKLFRSVASSEKPCGAMMRIFSFATCSAVTMPPTPPKWSLWLRSEEHTSELQSLMRISYAVFCLKKKIVTHRRISNSCNTIYYLVSLELTDIYIIVTFVPQLYHSS